MPLCPSPARILLTFPSDSICLPCLRKLSHLAAKGRRFYSTSPGTADATYTPRQQNIFRKKYFSDNDHWHKPWFNVDRGPIKNDDVRAKGKEAAPNAFMHQHAAANSLAHDPSISTIGDLALSHRRRKRGALEEAVVEQEIPLDASSRLSTFSSTLPQNSLRQRFFTYLSLSKPRLTFLIVLTTTTAYSLFPVAASPMSATLNLSPLTLLNLTAGTALSCAAANALNMLLEPEHDAKMSRTRSRPLVRGLLTKRSALIFAILTGAAGLGLLHFGVNPTVAFLSGLNILLYAGVYTPLKRISIVNTWAGAIVGGIPPLMGWAAAAGQATTSPDADWRELLFGPESAGGWLLAALLFAWQFPHFNALSYTIRHEYANAGYRMLASINPRKNALIAFRYSLVLFPVCVGLSYVGVTGWAFVGTSGLVNAWVVKEAWRFWRYQGERGSARGLFWASVWHLPLVLVLAMVHKRGLWERFVRGGLDEQEFEGYANEHEEEHEVRGAVAREA